VTLEFGKLALKRRLLPGSLFFELVQICTKLAVLDQEEKRDKGGSDY
jgi:hypothetical protein